MPTWQGKSKGTKIGYRIFVFVLRQLGVFPAYFVLRFVAFYYFLFSWNSTPHIYYYFRKRLSYSPFISLLKVYQNYYVFGQTLLDKTIVMGGMKNPFTYFFDGVENLKQIVSMGKGGILLSAHAGNWEIAGHFLNELNTQVNIVMYDGEDAQIKQYLSSVTGARSFQVIIIKEDMSHVYAIGEALRKNELVCLHADRFLEGTKTITKDFLGEAAQFPEGPFALAAIFKVPVSFVFAFKETDTHYHFYGSPPVQYLLQEEKRIFVNRLLEAYIHQVALKVKLYPLQWFNYYNFWA
jgi:predicted LPLAT superfamily acyltransferase